MDTEKRMRKEIKRLRLNIKTQERHNKMRELGMNTYPIRGIIVKDGNRTWIE